MRQVFRLRAWLLFCVASLPAAGVLGEEPLPEWEILPIKTLDDVQGRWLDSSREFEGSAAFI